MNTTATHAAHPAASARRKVHPAARWVAGLFSPMSLRDQEFCATMFQRILWGSLAVSFPIAYGTGRVLITVIGLCAAVVVCIVLFVPNWYQNPDPALKYADDREVYNYYQQYEAAKRAAREASAGSKKDTAAPAASPGDKPCEAIT
ncbi:hypothetical protein LSCM1_05451 [Leishmania martiniquensis]|uniref:Microsomal signal peptidase 12 kDa subunit n=1 Tax=Leishmania martiniquensis TaxID=1580590 RepID=A0A836KIG9_9TRYP|nr:hypothetical protein LSCM1_05451 [Leishmania martiniquensis]